MMKIIIVLILFFTKVNFGYSNTFTFKIGITLHSSLQRDYQIFTDPSTWPIDQSTGVAIPQKRSLSENFKNLYDFNTEWVFNVLKETPLYSGLSFHYMNQRIKEKETSNGDQEDFSLIKTGIPVLYGFKLMNGFNLNGGIVFGLAVNKINKKHYRKISYVPEPGAEPEIRWELMNDYNYDEKEVFIFPRIDIEFMLSKKLCTSLIIMYEYLNFKYSNNDLDEEYKFSGLAFGLNFGYIL